MGFISLLLTILQDSIAGLCIPRSVAETWHPCANKKNGKSEKDSENNGRKLLEFFDPEFGARRSLAGKALDKCTAKVRKLESFSSNDFIFYFFQSTKVYIHTQRHTIWLLIYLVVL